MFQGLATEFTLFPESYIYDLKKCTEESPVTLKTYTYLPCLPQWYSDFRDIGGFQETMFLKRCIYNKRNPEKTTLLNS